MNEAMQKFSADEKTKLLSAVVGESVVKILSEIKESEDGSNTFEVIFTTGSIDRHGETVNPDGWSFENYMLNPVILYAHNYSELPIGKATDIRRDGDKWIAKGIFAPEEASPLAGYVSKLYKAGFIKTVSVGFMPLELDSNFNSLKQELLEISFVPVPANPEALSLAKKLGLDVEELKAKNILVDIKTVETKTVETEPVEKAGRVLSEKNRALIKDCADGMRASIRSMEKSIAALDELYEATSTGEEEEVPSKSGQDVNIAHIQRLLRVADKAIEDGLRAVKSAN